MSQIVSLKDVADALEAVSDTLQAFLVCDTGEVLMVTEGDLANLENEEDEDMPEWQREHVAQLRKIFDSDQVFALPTSFDIHAWSIMEQFSQSLPASIVQGQLLQAIHGRGAFRMFRILCEENGLLKDWYSFRRGVMEDLARKWLEANGVPYK